MKRRIAFFISHPIQYAVPLFRKLASQSDLDLTVLYYSRKGVDAAYRDAEFGVRVSWDVPLLEGYRHKFLPSPFTGILKEIRGGRYDAVIVHGHGSLSHLWTLIAAKICAVPVLMRGETHLGLPRSFLKRGLRGIFMRILDSLCAAFLCIGTKNREFYAHYGIRPAKLFSMPYAVDNDRFAGGRKGARAAGDPLILYVGKLIPKKRPMDIVSAYADLRSRGVRARLLIVGDGKEKAALVNRIRRDSIPNCEISGFQNQSALPELYASAGVLAVTSEIEPWGLVVNEAMAAGTPVVATQETGAAADLVQNGETGFTYPAGDVSALGLALETVLKDSGLREQMSRNCLRRMEGWNYDRDVEGIRAAVEAVANRNAGTASCKS